MTISIITVTYNAAKTLQRTLESVETQSYEHIQHIIMDGGSKDGTMQIVENYKQRNANRFAINAFSEKDNGLYDAMNKAIGKAIGDYIVFLNAGDKLHENDTLKKVAECSEDDVAIIYGDTDIVDNNGNLLYKRRLAPPIKLKWATFKAGMLVCHQSFYISRKIIPLYDLSYKFSADFDWCIRCMKESDRLGMRNIGVEATAREDKRPFVPLTDYLSEGMTTANHKASLLERFNIMTKHYGLLTTILQHIWFIFRIIVK